MARVFENDKRTIDNKEIMIRVAIICHFSNEEIRAQLKQEVPWWERLGMKIMGRQCQVDTDLAVWITNAIKEFEKKTSEVEIHIIAPAGYIDRPSKEFELRGIKYFFFNDEQYSFSRRLNIFLGHNRWSKFIKNRGIIKEYLCRIKPQLVHVIGAENPRYSLSLLDVPSSIPTVLSLQTLLNDDGFFENYPIAKEAFDYLSKIELELLNRTNYIATTAEKYKFKVLSLLPGAKVLPLPLPLGEGVKYEQSKKEYDFVYFARTISKAVIEAIESFAIAHKDNPTITLDVIGEYTKTEKKFLDNRLLELGIKDSVFFEGLLPTHQDVLQQMRKARFALLPLKVDLISGTIREAMANGLPVLTTDTGELGTQLLNKTLECALIAPQSDYEAMAANMITLLNSTEIQDRLQKNGYALAESLNTNARAIDEWIRAYRTIIQTE